MNDTNDFADIHEIFLEECAENLDVLEAGLLELKTGITDLDLLNNIFRAAHSIKGGAATFGFIPISEFTHHMETLLDEMRNENLQPSSESVHILLSCVDVLRVMMEESNGGAAVEQSKIENHINQLRQIGVGVTKNEEQVTSQLPTGLPTGLLPTELEQVDAFQRVWAIRFKPKPHLLETGNDPLNLFHELEKLGTLTVKAKTGKVPDIEMIDPHQCFIHWELKLIGEVSEDQIAEVFDWVEFDCELEIKAEDGIRELSPEIETINAKVQRSELNPGTSAKENECKQGELVNSATVTVEASSSKQAKPNPEAGSIRVSTHKIDQLIDLVGELVITQSMLRRFGEEASEVDQDALRDSVSELLRNTRQLQESVMMIRMLPISFCFARFPRLVHDMSAKLGKKINLEMVGENTEVDKTVLEKISDPLVHLVRNALDHGIESPNDRLAAGKDQTGTITLKAFHEGANVVLQIIDDGAGLNRTRILAKAIEKGIVSETEELTDEQIDQLIFKPGFSTAEAVSDVSGRGVGMDVVRRNIVQLSGRVDVKSVPGQGSVLTISLPLTLAILEGQLIRVGNQIFIISLLSIIETVSVDHSLVNNIAGDADVYRLRGEHIPIIHLSDFAELPADRPGADRLLVIVEGEGQRVGILVDELLGQQQVVIKSLEKNFRAVPGVTGATILGDGTVALIIDTPGLIKKYLSGDWQVKSLLSAKKRQFSDDFVVNGHN